MIAVVCVDEKYGMMFHSRRQSQDRVMRENMLGECRGKRLYMSPYSGRLFQNGSDTEIDISEDFARKAGVGDFCFFEDAEILKQAFTDRYGSGIETVILYKWNRRYPADSYFPVNLSEGGWELLRTEEFSGSSHERITKEVYKRV